MRRSDRPGAHARHAGAIARLQALGLAFAAVAALLGSLALARADRPTPVLLALGIALLAAAAWRQRRAQRWRIGRRSERAVALRLRRLERRGWVVLHDVDRGRGNIDHVVIGRRGVFAVETKTTSCDKAALAQARDNARWLSQRLRLPVVPVVCVVQRRQPARLSSAVLTVDLRGLPRALRRQRTLGDLDPQAVAKRVPGTPRGRS